MVGGVTGLQYTLVRLLQSSNARYPIVVTLSGIVTLVRLLQAQNACASIKVTLSGIVTFVRLLHPWNAPNPIAVTLSGIVTLVRLRQFSNVQSPIMITTSGIIYSVSPAGANELSIPSIIKHLPSSDTNLPLNSIRLLQLEKAHPPIVVTLSGIVILVRLLQ